ncbi:MAG: hypothetical protein KGQ59_10875, partial [Bdellovibrionales bacterium]|nr:hypothetical protein [Bdellovibrionales bacterium]
MAGVRPWCAFLWILVAVALPAQGLFASPALNAPPNASITTEIDQLELELIARKKEIQENLVRMGQRVRGKDLESSIKWASSRDFIRSFDLALDLLNQARSANSLEQREKLLFSARQISKVLLANIENLKDLSYQKDYLLQRLKPMRVGGKMNSSLPEAANLVDPTSGKTLSASELEQLRAQGVDLSLLNPKAENGVIDLEQKISARRANSEGQILSSMYEGVSAHFPETARGEFKEFIYSQTKPKMKLKVTLANGERGEVKLKIGQEVRSDVTASTLAG